MVAPRYIQTYFCSIREHDTTWTLPNTSNSFLSSFLQPVPLLLPEALDRPVLVAEVGRADVDVSAGPGRGQEVEGGPRRVLLERDGVDAAGGDGDLGQHVAGHTRLVESNGEIK